METRWIVKASLILFLLSFDPQQTPNAGADPASKVKGAIQ